MWYLPFVLLGTLAAGALVGFLYLHQLGERFREEIADIARPARELLTEKQIAFSTHNFNLQKYLLSGDEQFLNRYQDAAERQRVLTAQLTPLLDTLGLSTNTHHELERLLAAWNAPVAALLEGRIARESFDAAGVGRDELHADILAAMAALRHEINGAISRNLDRIRMTQALQVLLAMALTIVALAAALERTRLARSERSARAEAERRARDEAALREAASAVASAETVEDTVRRIAESALISAEADAAVVERIDPAGDLIEIISTSGACAPLTGGRFPYVGSVSQAVFERQGPVRSNAGESEGPGVPEYLLASCGAAKVLAVPLLDSERPIGSLILARTTGRRDFDATETERLRTFADLAALEFRRIRLLSESEQRRLQLERVTESRTRLIRGFSHDVKNALGAADGYAQLIEEGVIGAPTARETEGIARLRQSLRAALKLTNDLLQLALAEAGHIGISWRGVDVSAVVRASTEQYRLQAEGKDLSISLELPEGLPLLRSDPDRIHQVMGNLISNAVKYTPRGGRISVNVRRRTGGPAPSDGSWISVSVVDNGPGIPEDQQHRVFEEFTRLSHHVDGSGLGLAISRRVARALQGELTVSTAPGTGCEFTLWLPLAPTGPNRRGVDRTRLRRQAS